MYNRKNRMNKSIFVDNYTEKRYNLSVIVKGWRKMENKEKLKFKIESEVVNNYVKAINSVKVPMNQLKDQLNQISKSIQKNKNDGLNESTKSIIKQLKNINIMFNTIKKFSKTNPNEQTKIFMDTIKQIMAANNGMLSTRMIEPLNISRQYLSIMENNNIIEKTSRGIYILRGAFEDSYFSFQQKYKKVIFSHMNALYFYGMTEEFPYNYTVTVPQGYHVDIVNEKCNVFYVSDDIYKMGITEVKTPSGCKVRVYDKERCICDIIRSKGRMDSEQVKKSIKQYILSYDKDIAKLYKYSKKLQINEKVMELVGDAYYD